MDYIEVQGSRVPVLGFGTWKLDGQECYRSVKDALSIGYRHIDTAQAYGNESQVGCAIKDSEVDRDDIWLTTKLWRNSLNSRDLKSSVEKSLEKLSTGYVDLLLIHWSFPEMDLEAVLKELSDLDTDQVKNIGVSNFTSQQVERAIEMSKKPLLTDQVEYHPFLNQDQLLEKCRSNSMMLTAYSPIARGEVLGNDTLKEIGEKYSKSEVQVALRWLIQQDKVAAIPKASSKEHRKANFDIFNFELSQEEMERIYSLTSRNLRKVDPEFAPNWD